MNIPWKSWAVLGIMGMFSACSPENSKRRHVVIIELDVFSGRPNPSWSLSEAQIIELREACKDLPPTGKFSREIELGYRGFLILNPGRTGGLSPHIRIYGGIVAMIDDNEQFYQDVHGIEHRLLLQASQHGYKAIVDSVLEDKSTR